MSYDDFGGDLAAYDPEEFDTVAERADDLRDEVNP